MRTQKTRVFAMLLALCIAVAVAPWTLAAAATEDFGTQRSYLVSLLRDAGMSETMLGTDADKDALIKSLGFVDQWDYSPTATVTADVKENLDAAVKDARDGLERALRKQPREPYFVNGVAQPIFPYGNSIYNDTSGQGIARYIVYVETDLDTDGDGKLDLIKTLVQVPRAALEGGTFSAIYEARPYIEGTGSQSVPTSVQNDGNTYLDEHPTFSHDALYAQAPARVPAGKTSTADMVKNANYLDWYYRYSYNSATGLGAISPGSGENETEYEDLNWYDYFLVRGFAVVQSAGLGSAGSEGYASCGADIEINAFKAVIEWLTGDRKAYSDKTSCIEVEADWSNGNVGMTGRSYAGTTQFGLATTGVKGLKTIVPVAGIASWYEYTNSQGVANSIPYSTGLAWYVNSRVAAVDWSDFYNRYAAFSQVMRREETALVGDYGEHWRRRDYTVLNWYKDWGPDKIQTPMLIVHGANDDNVRPKQSVLMYEAAKKAGVDVRWIWHQGHHMTPTFPRATPNATDSQRPYSMYVGAYTYDEWLNQWFSYYLYDVDNGVLDKLPGVLAQDNDSGAWVSYDSWDAASQITLSGRDFVPAASARTRSFRLFEQPQDYTEALPIPKGQDAGADATPESAPAGAIAAETSGEIGVTGQARARLLADAEQDVENIATVNSANGGNSWQNYLSASTPGSVLYASVLPDDVTVRGVTRVSFSAAVLSLGANAAEPLRVHAKLVEIAPPGTTLKYYGGNAVGSSIAVDRIETGGTWQGGGAQSLNLVAFRQTTTGTYREIAKGWLDLCNPDSGFDSRTAAREDRIVARDNIGVFHDYSLYLQPAIHTAKAGSKLALILTTGGTNAAAYTGNNAFTFALEKEKTEVLIPTEPRELSLDDGLSIRFAATTRVEDVFAPTFNLEASESVRVRLSVASYKDGKMVAFNTTNKALEPGEKGTIQAEIPYETDCEYKFFFWDDGFAPLSGATDLNAV